MGKVLTVLSWALASDPLDLLALVDWYWLLIYSMSALLSSNLGFWVSVVVLLSALTEAVELFLSSLFT